MCLEIIYLVHISWHSIFFKSFQIIGIVHCSSQSISLERLPITRIVRFMAREFRVMMCIKRMTASLPREIGRTLYYTNDFDAFERDWTARNESLSQAKCTILWYPPYSHYVSFHNFFLNWLFSKSRKNLTLEWFLNSHDVSFGLFDFCFHRFRLFSTFQFRLFLKLGFSSFKILF